MDTWATCDQDKLNWIRQNQNTFRADLYWGLADILLQSDVDLANTGRQTILPSSHTGSDCFMMQLFQDSIAIVRHFGRPTFFITFTANPCWQEIQDELLHGQTASDRSDLIAGVFHLKMNALLHEIKCDHIFGHYKGCVWTIEYQK